MGLGDLGRRVDRAVLAQPVPTVHPPRYDPSLGPVVPLRLSPAETRLCTSVAAAASVLGVTWGVLQVVLFGDGPPLGVLYDALLAGSLSVRDPAASKRVVMTAPARNVDVRRHPLVRSLLLGAPAIVLVSVCLGLLTPVAAAAAVLVLRRRQGRWARVEAAYQGRLVRLVRRRGPAERTSRTYLLTG